MEIINQKLIVVLGMHRSGTSAITRGLQALGVDLGNNLMPPGPGDNDKGYWEDIDLNLLNLEILQSLGRDWHFLKPLQSTDVSTLLDRGFLQRAVELLHNKTSHTQIFGFKDPRVAKLLPFWKVVFSKSGLEVMYVIVIRHPLSVAKSLSKRDGFSLEKSTLLWLDHVVSSLVGTNGEIRLLVDYDKLMQSPEQELERIASVFHLQVNALEVEKFNQEFLDHRLRHTVYQPTDLLHQASISTLVKEVYSALIDVEDNKVQLDNPTFRSTIDRWWDEYLRLTPILEYVDKLNSIIDPLYARNVELDAQVQSLTKELNEIVTSKAWKVALFLRQVRLKLLPPQN